MRMLTGVIWLVARCAAQCSKEEFYAPVSDAVRVGGDWDRLVPRLTKLLREAHVVVPYTSGSRPDVWDALSLIDADPPNSSFVRLIYSPAPAPAADHTQWNREHLLPRCEGAVQDAQV